MGNPVGVTDTISRPPRSTRRPHSPFPHAPLLPRRSGLCYLTTFCRPVRASVDWVFPLYRGCALAGSTACLWSDVSPRLAGIDDCPLVETMFALSLSWHSFSRRTGGTPVNGTIADGEPRRGDGHHQPPATFHPPHALSISPRSAIPCAQSSNAYRSSYAMP